MSGLKGIVIALVLLLQAVPVPVRAAAAPELAGVWQGKLAIDASNSLTVQFTFTKSSNGVYTAVLDSPDNPALKGTAVSSVSWDGSTLKLQVPSLSGSYAGTLRNGRIGGQWTQTGAALPLELAPWQKPVLNAATMKSLTGSWSAVLQVVGVTQNLVFQFRQGADGGIEGKFSIPDQGVNLPISSIAFEKGELSLKVPAAQLDYKGRLAGDQITGKLTSPSNPALQPDGAPLILRRGEYKVVAPVLKLNAEAFAALKGKWQGQMELTNPQTSQKAQIPVILRFENNAQGQYVGYMDSPAQGASGLVMSEASLADGKLLLKIPSIGAELSGTVAGKTLSGEWAQPAANFRQQVTLTRQ